MPHEYTVYLCTCVALVENNLYSFFSSLNETITRVNVDESSNLQTTQQKLVLSELIEALRRWRSMRILSILLVLPKTKSISLEQHHNDQPCTSKLCHLRLRNDIHCDPYTDTHIEILRKKTSVCFKYLLERRVSRTNL